MGKRKKRDETNKKKMVENIRFYFSALTILFYGR